MSRLSVEEVKQAATGRWLDILERVGGIDRAILDGKGHPCPKCGGDDRFKLIDQEAGALLCRKCFSQKNGDGVAALQWLLDCDLPTVLKSVASYLNIPNGNGNGHKPTKRDFINEVCALKRMPVESALAYGTDVAKRGKLYVLRVPVVNATGEPHSYFDLTNKADCKGLFKKGKGSSGLFIPHLDGKPRLPQAGEAWVMCEGVKDAAAYHSLEYLACGLPGDVMAEKYARLFGGCDVAIMPDRTVDAEEKAQKTAARLHGVAASVRIGTLPLEIGGGKGDDARDVLALPGGRELLKQAVLDSVVWRPSATTNAKPAAKAKPPAKAGAASCLSEDAGRTESANARRLVAKHGADFRFCDPWKSFLIFDGQRWAVDSALTVEALMKCVASGLWGDMAEIAKAVPDARELQAKMMAFVSKSNQQLGIRNAMLLARSEPGIPVLPDSLDRDNFFLNCPNGTVDLRTGEMKPHDRADLITKLCPTRFNPEATSFHWDRFLESIFGDQELIDFVRRLLGYCLTGDIREQLLAIFYGDGSNGKSTLLEAYMHAVGKDYTMQGKPDFLMANGKETHATERMDLFGMRFVSCAETEDNHRINESFVKLLTGGEAIRGRKCKQDPWQFNPTHKIILSTNHKPRVRGNDHAIWRRLCLVPFSVKFWDADKGQTGPAELRCDKKLKFKLEEEAEGILAWAVRGCLEWQAGGLRLPEAVKLATTTYQHNEDVVGKFLAECTVKLTSGRMLFKEIYEAMESWADDMGENRPSRKYLSQYLQDKDYKRDSKGGKVYFENIGLNRGA